MDDNPVTKLVSGRSEASCMVRQLPPFLGLSASHMPKELRP